MRRASWLRNGRWMAALLSLALGLAPANAQTQNRAGLVIRYGDGRLATACVQFGEPSITGLDLLTRSGLSVHAEVGGLGAAVCAINGQGCAYPAQPCFCQCQGANCAYWNYWHLIDGVWQYSSVAASSYTITDGAVDGWAWGDNITPPPYTIDQICADSPAAPTTPVAAQPTASTEATLVPIATATPEPAAPGQVVETPAAAALTPVASPTQPAPTEAPPPAASSDTVTTNSPAQADVGSYAVFAIAVIVLGSWLIVTRMRRR